MCNGVGEELKCQSVKAACYINHSQGASLRLEHPWGESVIKNNAVKENRVALQHEECPPSAVTQPVDPR